MVKSSLTHLPYFSVHAKKSQEQSARLEASTPLDQKDFGVDDQNCYMLKIGMVILSKDLKDENLDGMLREVQSP